jgi:mRNA export factor
MQYLVNHENSSPVLCTAFSADGSTVFSGGADNAVRMWQLGQTPPNNLPQQIGQHDGPVKGVGFLKGSNLVVSGGWDRKLKFWDMRTPTPAGVRYLDYALCFVLPYLCRNIIFAHPPFFFL